MRFKEVREVGKRFQQKFSHYVSGCSVTTSSTGKLIIRADLERPLPEGFKLPSKFEDVEIIVGGVLIKAGIKSGARILRLIAAGRARFTSR